jgi:SAM-dependent methyltransferase
VRGVAEAYDRHVGRYGPQLAAELVHVAALRRGQRALDVGCGPGALTRALADAVGAEHVAAVDPSEAFVAACRARVPGADVRVGVGERLPFDDGHFDAVLAQLVVQLMDDREAGVLEMARVARPGGVLAACVWDSTRMPLLSAFWDAAAEVAPDRTAELDEGRQVGYASADELQHAWAAAGVENIRTGDVLVHARYADLDDLMAPFAAGVGHSGACFTALDDAHRRRLRDRMHDRLGRADGAFTLTARAWWVCGAAPDG